MKYIKETVNDKVYFEEILSEGNMGRVVCQEENGDSTKGSAKDFFQACFDFYYNILKYLFPY